ncbi:MAG: PepSY-like domain-containing protein [Marinifilaceae bacterium]
MIKKLLLVCACVGTFSFMAKADNDITVPFEQMPSKIKTFVKQNFGKQSVVLCKLDDDLFDANYDVYFDNGVKLEFNKRGEWKEVSCKKSEVPSAIIPNSILAFVKNKFNDTRVVKIERGAKYYEIELCNNTELKFDHRFNLIEIDN